MVLEVGIGKRDPRLAVGGVGVPCGGMRGNDNVEEQWFGRGNGFAVGSVRHVRVYSCWSPQAVKSELLLFSSYYL